MELLNFYVLLKSVCKGNTFSPKCNAFSLKIRTKHLSVSKQKLANKRIESCRATNATASNKSQMNMTEITPPQVLSPGDNPGRRCNFFIVEEAIQCLTLNTLNAHD